MKDDTGTGRMYEIGRARQRDNEAEGQRDRQTGRRIDVLSSRKIRWHRGRGNVRD